MVLPLRRIRRSAGFLALALLGACAPDYSAVRDWSLQAREAVLPPAAARPPGAAATAPAPPAAVTAEGREGAALALREAAAAWLSMLAYIADDGQPRVRTNQFQPLADVVRPIDSDGAAAVLALGDTMADGARRNWRAPQLGVAAARGDPSFQAVMAALGRQVATEAPDAEARGDTLSRIAEGHALLKERQGRLSAGETARLLRLQESELRRLVLLGGG
ncbi:MAG: hypothetical protein MUC64_13980 [Rubritepida sp.]|jgi:hypothetical protein|nr:hypothetical protein [Rubritepida sp.]